MADADQVDPHDIPERSQALVGYMSNDEWDELLAGVNSLIQQMDELPAGDVKGAVFELLTGVDAIHREALRRLVRLFKEGVLEKVISDPAIHTLMELYDLLPEQTEEPLGDKPKSKFPTIPIRVLVPSSSSRNRFPHWLPALQRRDELASGMFRTLTLDDHPILLCRREDKFFAVESLCARDGSPMNGATLSTFTLACPNHTGCYYDVRQGTRIGGSEKIACYPVKVDEDDRVLVGLDMDFTPDLPSF